LFLHVSAKILLLCHPPQQDYIYLRCPQALILTFPILFQSVTSLYHGLSILSTPIVFSIHLLFISSCSNFLSYRNTVFGNY
jgi:hypothetical protein